MPVIRRSCPGQSRRLKYPSPDPAPGLATFRGHYTRDCNDHNDFDSDPATRPGTAHDGHIVRIQVVSAVMAAGTDSGPAGGPGRDGRAYREYFSVVYKTCSELIHDLARRRQWLGRPVLPEPNHESRAVSRPRRRCHEWLPPEGQSMTQIAFGKFTPALHHSSVSSYVHSRRATCWWPGNMLLKEILVKKKLGIEPTTV